MLNFTLTLKSNLIKNNMFKLQRRLISRRSFLKYRDAIVYFTLDKDVVILNNVNVLLNNL